MHETNIRSLDLNLLFALKALLEEQHVTRAAERIGLSQPAMSRALGRLRHVLKDPLLVRSESGLILTARAHELFQPLTIIFNELKTVISQPSSDPAKMHGEILIATRDYEMVAILPPVISYISEHAPHLSISVSQFIGDNLNLLDKQETDFIIAATDSKSATLHRQTLYLEDYVCLVAANHPVSKQKLVLKNYIALKHCLVTITGFGPGIVDTLLEREGLKRRVALRVPSFLVAAEMVADSDLIVTLPRKLGERLAARPGLTLLEPPLKLKRFPIYLYWHISNHNNPQHKWLRQVIRDAVK